MPGNFSFQLDDKALQKTLGSMVKAAQDYSEPLESAGEELIERYGEGPFSPFAKQQTGSGEKFKEWSPLTVYAREKRQGHYAKEPIATDKILIWTGDMMRGFYKKVTKVALTIGNNVEYFKHNQRSQRKMLFINSSVVNIVARHLMKHTNNSMKK